MFIAVLNSNLDTVLEGLLQGPPARNATLAWPHQLCATGSTLRVFDLQLGSLAQSLKLAAPSVH